MNDYLKIVAAMLVWSTWGVMVRWIALPPVVILFYTALIASVAVPIVLKLRGEFDLTGVALAWPLFTVLAVFSIVNNVTYFYALANTTVSNDIRSPRVLTSHHTGRPPRSSSRSFVRRSVRHDASFA